MVDGALTVIFAGLALCGVLVLAWLVIRALALLRRQHRENRFLTVKATLSVGARERLMVVDYHGEDLLLGVTSSGICLLDRRSSATADSQAQGAPVHRTS